MMTPQSIRDRYAEFVARQIAGGIEDPAGLLEGSLDVLDDIIAGRETVLASGTATECLGGGPADTDPRAL